MAMKGTSPRRKFAVIRFPGSNCDQDCYHVLNDVLKQDVRYVWHKDTHLEKDEIIILPGGFSYGDYLRCGALACFSPIMAAVKEAAARGQLVLGICNGFQILCEVGLLPGALVRNRDLHFICENTFLRMETNDTPFTSRYTKGQTLRIPIAHGDGCYMAEDSIVEALEKNNQIVFRYADADSKISPAANPNGSTRNIAGICNETRNVLGMMPHPERACEELLGETDGLDLFQSLIQGNP